MQDSQRDNLTKPGDLKDNQTNDRSFAITGGIHLQIITKDITLVTKLVK